MPKPTRLWQLACPACQGKMICANADMVARLRAAGMLKREKVPDATLMEALLPTASSRLQCEACGHVGLVVSSLEDEWDDDFTSGRACETCGAIISPERLDALPDTRHCAACQQRRETGEDSQAREFCSRCGGLLKMRQTSQGGLTRYTMSCSSCGL